MDLKVSIAGLVVGLLVGLTSMGGGAIMTPLLILLGWARPTVAVGTDLVWGALTKSVGALVHYRQKTVDPAIVKRLAAGSIPGALVGIALLAHLRRLGLAAMDHMVVRILGVALIMVALVLFLRSVLAERKGNSTGGSPRNFAPPAWLTTAVAAVVGFLVSLTSVGSGSLIVACLVLIYPTVPLRRIVGSDIVNALLLVGVSALGHLGLGSIDFRLLAALLLGSVPGVWLGSRMSAVFPERALRPILASTLLFLGYKLL
jgi:uncharacterized membrane protein YfcA